MARQLASSWVTRPMEPGCRPPRAGRSRWSPWMRCHRHMRAPERCRGSGSFEESEDKAVAVARSRRDARGPEAAQFPEKLDLAEVEEVKAWELIDAEIGRYMPRRIRGSFRG